MLEWPEGIGLFILFVGLIGFLVHRSLLKTRALWLDWWYVLVVLLSAISALIFASLEESRTKSGAGLFQYDGFSLYMVLCLLIFGLIVHVTHFYDRKISKPEVSGLELSVLFLGATLILSNHLILYVTVLPILILITFFAPRLSVAGQSNESLFVGIAWAFVLLALLALSAGLWYESTGSLQLTHVQETIITYGRTPAFVISWSGFATVFLVLLLLAPFGIFFEDYKQARSWALVGSFRLTLFFIANALFLRWILIIGENSFIGATDLSMLSSISVSLSVVLLSILSRDLLQVVQTLSLQPFLMVLWSIAHGPSSRGFPDLHLGLASLILFVVGVPRLLQILRDLGLTVSNKVEDLHLALRGASFFTKLEVFVFIFALSPFGTFLGMNLLTKSTTGPHELIESICAASLGLSLVMVLAKIFAVSGVVEVSTKKFSAVQLLLGFACVLTVIVLGIYPTPLYNYIEYLLHPS